MRYVSTRGEGSSLSFKETILTGLARDGGLFLPEEIPDVSDKLESWSVMTYSDLAFEIMSLYADDLPDSALRAIIDKSYGVFRHEEVTPVVSVGPLHILELFHGPTLAFKDVALQFLGNLFEYVLEENGNEMNIVAATSGDTGSAAIYGVRGRDRIRIFVLHPNGRVSDVQERQMTSVLDDNVFNLGVTGTFDDCQNIVKELFGDLDFRDKYKLGAVNSINWARVLAQVVYYFYAAFRVQEKTGAEKVRFAVPTGNFGDIFAGYIARQMGLPIDKLVLATNENDILSRYFNTGEYTLGEVAPTLSPSMDIQLASNFERYLYYLSGKDSAKLKEWMTTVKDKGTLKFDPVQCDDSFVAGRGDTEMTIATIKEYWQEYAYLLDPHTAVGVAVAAQFMKEDVPMIALATAHPAKFGDAIKHATGEDIAHHELIEELAGLPTRKEIAAADSQVIADFIRCKIEANAAGCGHSA
ncbi:MAG: threonine synthase [Kiritimatiellae bacterium]|jgi:threonine synthase|nr:threonine synthase [Kiritimatiellia bacterium]